MNHAGNGVSSKHFEGHWSGIRGGHHQAHGRRHSHTYDHAYGGHHRDCRHHGRHGRGCGGGVRQIRPVWLLNNQHHQRELGMTAPAAQQLVPAIQIPLPAWHSVVSPVVNVPGEMAAAAPAGSADAGSAGVLAGLGGGSGAAASPAGRPTPVASSPRSRPAFAAGADVSIPPFRAGYGDYLRTAGFGEVATVALSGVAGILLLTGAGGMLGYRQARAGHTVRSGGTGRFLS